MLAKVTVLDPPNKLGLAPVVAAAPPNKLGFGAVAEVLAGDPPPKIEGADGAGDEAMVEFADLFAERNENPVALVGVVAGAATAEPNKDGDAAGVEGKAGLGVPNKEGVVAVVLVGAANGDGFGADGVEVAGAATGATELPSTALLKSLASSSVLNLNRKVQLSPSGWSSVSE